MRQMQVTSEDLEMRVFMAKKSIWFPIIMALFMYLPAGAGFGGGRTWASEEKRTLKVALLPILDSLPFYVAEAKGYLSRGGYTIKAVPVASGLERDQLMQAGEIDAMLNEMTSTAMFNRKGVQVRILGVARKAYERFPMFRVVAAPGSGIRSPGDLAGVPIAVSMNTIIEYVTDRLLVGKGLSTGDIVKRSVPVIPERYQLLMQGRLKAATLPDPLGISALRAGALPVIDDSSCPDCSVSVLTFSMRAIREKPEAIRHFLAAWDLAAGEINSNPETYRSLLLKKIRVPRNVQEDYPVPPFPRSSVPAGEQWLDVMDWMIEKGLIEQALPYEESVSRRFLPR
ncbi:MAG: ABC transporter substrate-binding protein [Deltaproteobacteria bacterium]|nr:ABC transporter substrate-binding protein [Deltaproteobacteria bacterium]